MSEPTNTTASAEVEEDLLCARCDANLRGLSRDGACPNCGTPVAAALAYKPPPADPVWLARIHLGAVMLGWASMIVAAVVVLRMSLNWLGSDGEEYTTRRPWLLDLKQSLMMMLMALDLPIIAWIGAWLVSMQKCRDEVDPGHVRVGLRIAATSALVLTLVPRSVLSGIEMKMGAFGWLGASGGSMLVLLTLALRVAVAATLLVYVRRLSREMRSAFVVANAYIVMWGVIIATVLQGAGVWMRPHRSLDDGEGAARTLVIVTTIATIIFEGYLAVVMLSLARSVLKRMRTQAECT